MGIVNAGQLAVYEEIEPKLKELVEDVLLNRRPDATERLVDFAETVKGQGAGAVRDRGRRVAQRAGRRAAQARAAQGRSSSTSTRTPKKPGRSTRRAWRSSKAR